MADLLRPASSDVDLAIADMIARDPRLDAERTGTLVNTIAGVIATLKRDAQRTAIREFSKTYVSTARGEDLDVLAFDHFGLSRHPATGSVGDVSIARTSDDGAAVIEAGLELADEDGNAYAVAVQTAFSGLAGSVQVRSVATGPQTLRAAGFTLSPRGDGWPASLLTATFIASEGLVGGNAGETDVEFRERIGAWWRSLRRATVGAIRYAAFSIPEIRRATVDERRIRPERGGYVDLYVTDSQDSFNLALGRLVRAAVDRDGRAAGVVVNVLGAQVVTVPVRVRFVQSAEGNAGGIARAVRAMEDEIANLPIGATLYRSRLVAVAMAAEPSLRDVVIDAPKADLEPDRFEVIRTSGVTVL